MWWCCARPAADGSPRSHRTTEEYGAPKLLTPASAKDQQIVRAEASYSTPARAAAAARQLLDKPLNKLTAIVSEKVW